MGIAYGHVYEAKKNKKKSQKFNIIQNIFGLFFIWPKDQP